MKDREIRAIQASVELRSETRDDGTEEHWLKYTAPPFDQWSVDLGGFREKIAPDAFADSDVEVIATLEHDNRALLGRQSAETLKLTETDDGLVSEVLLNPDTTAGRDTLASAKRGDLRGASFEFSVLGDEWDEGLTERTVTKGVLFQTGPVANPAYELNDVELACRSREAALAQRQATDNGNELDRLREQYARLGVVL